MQTPATKNQNPYVTVKQACDILNCGRTKIYTHYIQQGHLEIRKKAGNRTLFLREEVEKLARDEQVFELAEFMNSRTETEAGDSKTQLQGETKSETHVYKPPTREEGDEALGEYISSLKQKIHDLNLELEEQRELLEQYKSRQLKSVSLVEYTEKIRHKDQKIAESQNLLELSEQRTRHLEEEQKELQSTLKNQEGKLLQSEEKFTQSLRVALTFKQTLKEEEEKRQQYAAATRKLRQLYRELEDCAFWQISLKRELRTSIDAILRTLHQLESDPQDT